MGHVTSKSEYLALQQRLDKNPIGAPAHKDLFAILEELFTPAECNFAARMPMKLSSASRIAAIAEMDQKATKEMLNTLVLKGLVADFERPDGKMFYFLNPTVIGFFEFTMMRVRKSIDQKKVAKLMWDYFHNDPDLKFMDMMTRGETFLARPLVHEDMLSEQTYSEVLDWEKATEIVENGGLYTEGLCHCRHVKTHMDEQCDNPQKYCLSFGTGAKYLLRAGLAKEITKERAMEILVHSRELGLVQMGDNVKNKPLFICNCCKCCCEMMSGFRTIPNGTRTVTSNYVAKVDKDECIGCMKCFKACPIEVISMVPAKPTEKAKKRNKIAKINEELCLGCGVCARQCKFDSMTMEPLPVRVFTPENVMEKTMVQALERGKLQNLLFDDPTKVTHRALNTFLGALVNLPPAKKLLAKQQIKSKFVQKMVEGFNKTKEGWMSKI